MNRIRRMLGLLRQFVSADDGSLRQKTVRASIWVGLTSVGLGSLSFVKSIILARLLIPEHFGMMAICMVVMRVLEVLTETGVSAALIQRPGDVHEAKLTVYTMTALRGLALALVMIAAAPFVAAFYEQPSLGPLLNVLAISLLLNGLSNVEYLVVRKELNFRPHFWLQQTLALLDFILTVVLAFWLRNVWALVLGQVFRSLVGVPLSFLLLQGRPRFGWNRAIARELLSYGKYISGITIVVFVTTEIDNIVVGKILGMEVLGIYFLAYMLANLPVTHLAKVVASVMFPAFSKMQDDRAALQRAYLQTIGLVATLAVPAAFGIAVLADEIVGVVFGPNWTAAAAVLPVLCVFGALRALSAINGYVFNAIGKPHLSFYMNLVKLIIIAAIIVPATRLYGLQGAAIAVTAPSVVMFLVSNVVFSRTLRLELGRMLGAVMPSVTASIAMGLGLVLAKHWLPIESAAALALAIAGATAIYFAINRSGVRAAIRLISGR